MTWLHKTPAIIPREAGSWKLGTRYWKLDTGYWKLKTRHREPIVLASIFEQKSQMRTSVGSGVEAVAGSLASKAANRTG
jgi:hypothetical protein